MSLSDHRKVITGARRRNNIYGEMSDYVVSEFLYKGGDGMIYNPNKESAAQLIGRSESKVYVSALFYQSEPRNEIIPEKEKIEKLVIMAEAIDAIPLYAVARSYAKKCRFYSAITGAKMSTFI